MGSRIVSKVSRKAEPEQPRPKKKKHLRCLYKKIKKYFMRRSLNSPRIPKINTSNTLVWMQSYCPNDILPKILAYAGPQMFAALNQTSRFWHNLMQEESTWRVLCEDLYKWKEGDRLPPSWRDYYRMNPCVPTDYRSIHDALNSASSKRSAMPFNTNPRVREQRRTIRIFVRPGTYVMREAITVHTTKTVSIETLNMPLVTPIKRAEEAADESVSSKSSRRLFNRANSMRNIISSCRSVSIIDEIPEEHSERQEEILPPPTRAQFVLQTRQSNQPIIRVRQGTVKLSNIDLIHNSNGTDIWNGNSAIQIQPPLGPGDVPLLVFPRPCAMLYKVDISSKSGRGIVNIDGGLTEIRQCYIHDCAATGIYVGGPGSHAHIEGTDVLRNGNGNRNRRGIARGHSGIYLEQGTATVRNCNISQNSLTGLSAISQDNAILSLELSDLIANGSIQLEMPADGTLARRRSLARNNNVSNNGMLRQRSGLIENI